MASAHEHEDVGTSRSEKLLAFVLAGFILVGALWLYGQLERESATPYPDPGATPAQQEAISVYEEAQRAANAARVTVGAARIELENRREAYRTALDAREPAGRLAARYRSAERRLREAQRAEARARTAASLRRPAADRAERAIRAEQRRAEERYEGEARAAARVTFVSRLLYVLAALGASYLLLARLRRRHSGYQAVALAVVGAAAIQALVFAGDYGSDVIDFEAVGPLVVSLVGLAFTLAAFVALRRYVTRRAPVRRARRGECPHCAWPARGSHCEGCGRALQERCSACDGLRRVGAPHCAHCGAA